MSRNILVTGAGGGIGRALVDCLAARHDVARVYAMHHNPVSSVCPKVAWLEADLDSEATLRDAAAVMHEGGGLDGIIQASGLLHGPGIEPEKSLKEVDAGNLMRLYATNAVGPLMVIKACQDLLQRPGRPFVCLLSAQVGSIGDNRLGGWYGYRMAKAALNRQPVSSPEHAAQRILTLIDDLGPDDTGRFFNYDGSPLPW